MKIIYNNYLPIKGYAAINLFGIVFARKEFRGLSKRVINHEAIHTAQVKYMLYLPFYLCYGIEWLVKAVKYRSFKLAYYNISFEREAYTHDRNLDYLKHRKAYAWVKYIRKT